jgi:hypothetical protein
LDCKKNGSKGSQRSSYGITPRSIVSFWRRSGRKSCTENDLSERLEAGAKVKVTGVDHGHNEQAGTVLRYIPEKKRYLVQFKDYQKPFKEANLVLVDKNLSKQIDSSPPKNSHSLQTNGVPPNGLQKTKIERRISPDEIFQKPSTGTVHQDPDRRPAGRPSKQKSKKPIKVVARRKLSLYHIPKKKGVQIHV